MEAELQKFRQKKIAEERSVRIKEYLQNIYNQWTLKLSAALLPEPQQGDKSGSSEDEDDDTSSGKKLRDKKLLLKKSSGKKLNKASSSSTQNNKDSIETVNEHDNNSDNDEDDDDVVCPKPIKWASIGLKVLKFLMWLLTYIGFIKIGFGAPFFAISALLFIWFSTDNRRRKRKEGEKSAYSVFNPNCEPIDGSLDAKQLEKQLIYGPIGHFAG